AAHEDACFRLLWPGHRVLLGSGFFSRSLGGRLFGRSGGGFLGGFFSGTLFLGAFESLGAGLALFGVVAGFALQKAGGIEETLDAIGRLGAVLEPVGDTLAIDHDAL